ncbi:MAG: hypothetical protein SGJ27_26905 [Candidatus Melainabacteria bacterium]|nr:hypothetical protein [Candidatus Melainabacteria bacterium]
MKKIAIVALVVVIALAAFGMGSSTGYMGMMISMIVAHLLMLALPAATALLALGAGIHALAAKAYKAKPNWPLFFKVSAGVYGITVLGALILSLHIIDNGFR